MFWFRSFSLLVFGTAIAAAKPSLRVLSNHEKSCDLDCPLNAPCVFGEADFSERTVAGTETHRNGMHCDCPIGWTGILCDKKYETCTSQKGHECYNGGECLLGTQDGFGNEQLFCDCSTAPGYVGKYCETPYAQRCGDDELFCINGGACNPNYPDFSATPCLCDEGWEGRNCQDKKEKVDGCNLDCQNGGVCSVRDGDGSAPNHLWSSDDGMFCKCPPGFGGQFCEVPVEYCGSSNGHFCLNGGECVTTSAQASHGMVQSRHHCDCTKATNDENDLFAGKYCEHKATSVCSDSDWNNFFCTQGGTCKSNPMDGCSCRDGTAGFKCEFNLEDSDQDNSISNPNDADGYFSSSNSKKVEPSCDGGYCLNGGSCFTEQTIMQDGTSKIEEYCDCSQAYDDNFYYAGVYCQYKSTAVCHEANPLQESLGAKFCVHNGNCRENGSCDCPDGWTGQFCELNYEDAANEGWIDMDGGDVDTEVDKCGETTCYNGGVCVQTQRLQSNGDFKLETKCDCSAAFDDKYLYAGMSCEFPSTQICSVAQDGKDLAGSAFCTNHGRCSDDMRLGCDCPPGFFGAACEYESRDKNNQDFLYGQEKGNGDVDGVCGDKICHHGGKCITSILYHEASGTSETSYRCDCSTAYDDETAYLGESCEYPATTICTPPMYGKPMSSSRFCVNHGTCSQDPSKDCDCGDGFAGRFCQLRTDFNVIDEGVDGNGKNGDDQGFEICEEGFPCFNGGKCATTTHHKHGVEYYVSECDCSPASDGADIFAGNSCEYKATSICDNSFCVNGGKCQENNICDCPLPWTGIHCEVPVNPSAHLVANQDESGVDIECNLNCMNGGVCVPGAKDLGVFHDGVKNVAHLNQTYAEDQFAHCACPSGWIGLTCENNVEVCGEYQHFCLHGSKCVPDADVIDEGYSCDCSQADDSIGGHGKTHVFAGDSCQYADMDICSIGKEFLRDPLYFCLHGGTCNAKVTGDEPNPGCTCPDNYTGPFCEVKLAAGMKSEPSLDVKMLSLITGLLVVLIGILVLVARYTRSLLMSGRKSGAVTTSSTAENEVPVTRTPFSPRRRRKAGFNKSMNQKPSISDSTHGPSSSLDANEGIMKDCSLDDDESPYETNQDEVKFSSTDDDDDEGIKVRGSHFV